MQYTCRMHPEVVSDAPGKCPKCRGCDLVPLEAAANAVAEAPVGGMKRRSFAAATAGAVAMGGGPPPPLTIGIAATPEAVTLKQYVPLLTVFGIVLVAAVVGTLAEMQTLEVFSWHGLMGRFMAGFFLAFSGFKLLDLPGFVMGYQTYDLLARRWPGWGYAYPFLELGLGLVYLAWPHAPHWADWATLALMGFSSLGVLDALRHKRTLQCACLGTIVKLPLTTVALAEDLGMAAMAAGMLLK
jgi:hypothetical protein